MPEKNRKDLHQPLHQLEAKPNLGHLGSKISNLPLHKLAELHQLVDQLQQKSKTN